MSKERGGLEQIKLSKVIAALLTYRNRFSYQSMNSAICAVPKYGLKSLLSFAYLLSHIIDLNCHLLFFFLEDMWSNFFRGDMQNFKLKFVLDIKDKNKNNCIWIS